MCHCAESLPMHWTKPLAAVVALGIALSAVGAVVTLVTEPLASNLATPAIVVLALVVVSLVVAGAAAAKSRRWLSNPYW